MSRNQEEKNSQEDKSDKHLREAKQDNEYKKSCPPNSEIEKLSDIMPRSF